RVLVRSEALMCEMVQTQSVDLGRSCRYGSICELYNPTPPCPHNSPGKGLIDIHASTNVDRVGEEWAAPVMERDLEFEAGELVRDQIDFGLRAFDIIKALLCRRPEVGVY